MVGFFVPWRLMKLWMWMTDVAFQVPAVVSSGFKHFLFSSLFEEMIHFD